MRSDQQPARASANTKRAAYAIEAGDKSAWRRFPEPVHPFRQPFQRDRDRVIHSRAFRRLDGKTQVFLNGSGDHFRTRLTHTIEVATLARTIARRLRLNEEVSEAIALAHDLGHTPFGHVGERTLNRKLADHGGFEHNRQSLRVVDHLEHKYPGFNGLNLTWAVRAGLVQPRDANPPQLVGNKLATVPSLEAQVADIADDLAYSTHDIDDGIEAGLITDDLLANLEIWQQARTAASRGGEAKTADDTHPYVLRCLIDMLVGNVIEHSEKQLDAVASACADEIPQTGRRLVTFTPAFQTMTEQLRTFLFDRLYWHPPVLEVNRRCERVVDELFDFFVANPSKMGRGSRSRIPDTGLRRSVADYIAGMTDHYTLEQHRQFCHTPE